MYFTRWYLSISHFFFSFCFSFCFSCLFIFSQLRSGHVEMPYSEVLPANCSRLNWFRWNIALAALSCVLRTQIRNSKWYWASAVIQLCHYCVRELYDGRGGSSIYKEPSCFQKTHDSLSLTFLLPLLSVYFCFFLPLSLTDTETLYSIHMKEQHCLCTVHKNGQDLYAKVSRDENNALRPLCISLFYIRKKKEFDKCSSFLIINAHCIFAA